MKAMLPARLSAKVAAIVATLAMLTPLSAHAETASSLPKGYTTDDAPAGQTAPAAQPAIDAQPAPAPAPDAAAPTQPAPASDDYSDTDPSALNDFREPLNPYGTWVDDPTYGTVWVPNSTVVGADFAPYQTAGHWTMDEAGDWMWVSDYDWGYVPFHYGRWLWIGGRGWSWIPGHTYAPAWVMWRTGEYGYIGWAPYPPAFYWSNGVAVGFWGVPMAPFAFCPTSHVFAAHVGGYVIHDRATVQAAAAHTQPYKPAQPHIGSTPGGAKAPSAAHASYRPASPSLQSAHVPTSAVPQRSSADPRALAYSKPSTTPHANARGPASSGAMASRATGGVAASGGASWAARHGISRPEGQAMLQETRHSQPAFHSSSNQGIGRGSYNNGYSSRGGSSTYRGGSAPSYRGSPSYSAPSRSYRGGGSVSGWSAPSSRSAPPAYHPSASPSHFGGFGGGSSPSYHPSTTHSAPAFHSGGGFGGFHGGGGGRHR